MDSGCAALKPVTVILCSVEPAGSTIQKVGLVQAVSLDRHCTITHLDPLAAPLPLR